MTEKHTKQASHTPINLPIYTVLEAGYCHLEDKKGHCVAEAEIVHVDVVKIFKFLCKAANNHDALVEACEQSLAVLMAVEYVYPGRFSTGPIKLCQQVLTQVEKEGKE